MFSPLDFLLVSFFPKFGSFLLPPLYHKATRPRLRFKSTSADLLFFLVFLLRKRAEELVLG